MYTSIGKEDLVTKKFDQKNFDKAQILVQANTLAYFLSHTKFW